MKNRRFDYHPFLAVKHLKRGVGNYCLECGQKMGNIRADLKNANQLWFIPYKVQKPVLVGYCHKICPDIDEEYNGEDFTLV